jgi:hypothetical protein
MKRYAFLALTIILILFIIAEPVLGAGSQMGGRGKASDMMEKGKNARAERGMHGLGFTHSAGNEYGEYVTFTIDNQTGDVLDYYIDGIALFNISIADFKYSSTSPQGSVTRVSNEDGSVTIQLHDNPAAVINILTNKNISITFTLAGGVSAAEEDNFVRIESGSVVGYIAGTGIVTSSVSSTQVKIDASPNSAVVFRAAPVNMPMFDNICRRFSQEIARNRVGLEAAFGSNRTFNTINYSEGLQMRVQEMEQDRIRLMINATGQAGHIIALNLDNSSLVIREHARLRIHYDGQPMDCVNDPNAVFNETDHPLCWISPIQDRVRAQLMMHVPNYSEHRIDIIVEPEVAETPANLTASPAAGQTPEAPGFEVMISLAGLLTWAYLGGRRNK